MIVQVHVESEHDIIDKDFETVDDEDEIEFEELIEELTTWLRAERRALSQRQGDPS